jgi:hypothetical protein
MPRNHSSLAYRFAPGICGRVKLRGANHIFEFACGRDCVILDSQISSPRPIFEELVEQVIEVD